MNRLLVALMLATATTASAQSVPDKSPHHSGFVTRNGVRLHYLNWGGPGLDMVVLVPGVNYNAHVFDDFAPRLKDLFGVIAITPRAHGQSDTPDSTMTIDDQVEDLATLLDSLHTGPVHLIGHGLSGDVVTRFAKLYPGRVKKLAFLDGLAPAGTAPQDLDENGKPFPLPNSPRALATVLAIENAVSPEIQQRRARARAALIADAAAHPPDYSGIRKDILSLRANKTMKSNYFWVDKSDAGAIERARAHLDVLNNLEIEGEHQLGKQADAKMAKMENLDGQHLFFLTDPQKIAFILRVFMRVFTANYLPKYN